MLKDELARMNGVVRMKEVAKRLLRSMAVRLPFGVSFALLDALSHRHGTNYARLIRQAEQAKGRRLPR
jgi:hypothetical protein